MKGGAVLLVMLLGAFGNAVYHPAFAQSSIGGPKAQSSIGGPKAQSSIGGPKAQSSVSGAAKQVSPVGPANKGGSITTSPPSHPKCPTGRCAAKGIKQ